MAPVLAVGTGFSPLDDELALLPGSLTPRLHEWLVRLGAWLPFTPAAELLVAFSAVAAAPATARRLTEAAGAVYVAQQTAAAPALAPPADPGPDTPTRLQVSVDGAFVRLAAGGWVEVKTCAIGEVQRAATGGTAAPAHATAVSYFSRLAEAGEFTRLAVVETHARGVRAAAEVAGVVDGALWLQSFFNYHRPDAVRILDHPHALEYVAAIGAAIWKAGSAEAQRWLAEQAHGLKEHGPGPLLAAVATLREEHADNEVVAKAESYLADRAAQLNYPAFLAAGWPIGSGMVESGNKLVVEKRLKGAGMGWAEGSVNPMLGLRNIVCSGRWEEAWPQIAAGLRAEARERRREGARTRREQRTQAQVGAPAVGGARGAVNSAVVAEVGRILQAPEEAPRAAQARVVGGNRGQTFGSAPAPAGGDRPKEQWRPAANHPWRRSPIGRAADAPAASART